MGLFGNRFTAQKQNLAATIGEPISLRLTGYKLISPLLATNEPEEMADFKPLETKLKDNIFDLLNDPNVATVSIYFRDLASGRWTGINENLTYDPASLIKVPIMIAWYKKAETDPSVLAKQLFYPGESPGSAGAEFYTLTPGTWYTVDDLIKAMIIKSDNGAKDLLINSIDRSSLNEVFSDLGIQVIGYDLNTQYQISAENYSLFFRILYNATYLNKDLSERALNILTETTFNNGIVAGVPASVAVAHKYGEDVVTNPDTGAAERELHDCGIVYHPVHPYLLCVMTKGTADFDRLAQLIKTASQTVYNEVNNNYK